MQVVVTSKGLREPKDPQIPVEHEYDDFSKIHHAIGGPSALEGGTLRGTQQYTNDDPKEERRRSKTFIGGNIKK